MIVTATSEVLPLDSDLDEIKRLCKRSDKCPKELVIICVEQFLRNNNNQCDILHEMMKEERGLE